MVQRVTISTDAEAALKPLLEAAIRSELKTLELGLRRTRERLAAFEARYGLLSADFERRFDGRDLQESLDFIEWLGEIKTLRRLEDQYRALASAQLA